MTPAPSASGPAPAPSPAPREQAAATEARRRERKEWLITGAAIALITLLLAYLSYNSSAADANGFLAGFSWRYLQGFVVTALIFALFTLGLNLQFGFTGLINFGHVAFMAIGAYTAAIVAFQVGGSFEDATLLGGLGYTLLILAIATAAAVAFGLLLGIPTLKLREDYLAILTIGSAEILRSVLLNEEEWTRGSHGINVRIPGSNWFFNEVDGWGAPFRTLRETWGVDLNPYNTFLILVLIPLIALVFLLLQRLARSPWGRVVRAIREDEDVAAALGKNVFVYKLQSLLIGAVVAASAGILYAWYLRFINPDSFIPIITFYAWIILVLGGVGNNKGVLVGSFILWGIFEAARNLPSLAAIGITETVGPIQVVFIGVLLVVIMMFRPQGALGRKEEMLFGK